MDLISPLRLFPTMPMLLEALNRIGWDCRMVLSEESRHYRGIRLFHRQQELHKDVLYLLCPEEREFPFDAYSYLSAFPHPGKANHLICPGRPDAEILDQFLDIFSQFQTWEDSMDQLVYRNDGLQDLVELGSRLLENPVCIHDDWFVMMAITSEYIQLMEPEYLMSSAKGFVPRAVVEDFQYDSDYLETYSHHGAHIWDPPGKQQQSLYVNLWDGPVYKGRMLVARKNRDFLHRDFLLAEALTQRAIMLLRRKQPGEEDLHQNMDDIVFALLQGIQPEQESLSYLLHMLRWQQHDRLLCLRLRPQQGSQPALSQHMLHSDLFRMFPGSYILLGSQEQCVIANLSQTPLSRSQLHYLLAPLCRDYCLYAGISSPVTGIQQMQIGYYQAGAALDQAFRQQNHQWILLFSECVLDHILQTIPSPLKPDHLVAPELRELMKHDQEKGTQFFQTFREYLLQERDIPRTSQALIIHRTTLLYRLQKIQSLIPVDLNDPWQRLYLMLSLWILENEKHKQPI